MFRCIILCLYVFLRGFFQPAAHFFRGLVCKSNCGNLRRPDFPVFQKTAYAGNQSPRFPAPGPAITATALSRADTASCCAGLRLFLCNSSAFPPIISFSFASLSVSDPLPCSRADAEILPDSVSFTIVAFFFS